jgi:ADP-ribose pyrophosphatase
MHQKPEPAHTGTRAAKKTGNKRSNNGSAASTKSSGLHPAIPRDLPEKPQLLKSKLAFKGNVFSVFTDTVIEPGGHKAKRDVVRHNGSVVILAVDDAANPSDPDVILERQYRHAAGQHMIEVPAGTRDKNESPLAAAKREMIEETGYRAKRWTILANYFASPGFLAESMQIYLAQDLKQGKAALEEDEKLEVFRLPLSEAMRMVAAGEIHDGKTLIALLLYNAARRDGRM